MTSMSQVIEPKSDQINADDLIGGDLTITISDVKIVGRQEQPVSIYFEGSQKAYRPCKSMSRVLVAIWGPDAKAYAGRSLRLYRDPEVKWGGMAVGGIRIRSMTHMEGNRPVTMALTATKGARKPYTVTPLDMPKPDPTASQIDPIAAMEAATAAARKGTAAFRDWWKASADLRDVVRPIMGTLQAICAEADKPAPDDADPFGLPPLTPDPEAEARAAFERERAAEMAALT